MSDYDEFGLFRDNAAEAGIPWNGQPDVRRVAVQTADGRLSALVWGSGPPEIVFLHGGAQNAHTWDTVALAIDRPLVCIDLPGHGHSDWRDDHHYSPPTMAETVAAAVSELAPSAKMVVGMSLGGMTAFCLAASHPDLVGRLVVVDVTPGTDHAKAEPIIAFVSGPETFANFDEILQRTIEYNPTRSESSLRRGVLHNARPQTDGTWVWRYDRIRDWQASGAGVGEDATGAGGTGEGGAGEGGAGGGVGDGGAPASPDFSPLWDVVSAVKAPLMLVRGGASGVVGDEDVVELLQRQPTCRVVVVDGAGHSVQGDRPVELARLLTEFAAGFGRASEAP